MHTQASDCSVAEWSSWKNKILNPKKLKMLGIKEVKQSSQATEKLVKTKGLQIERINCLNQWETL